MYINDEYAVHWVTSLPFYYSCNQVHYETIKMRYLTINFLLLGFVLSTMRKLDHIQGKTQKYNNDKWSLNAVWAVFVQAINEYAN